MGHYPVLLLKAVIVNETYVWNAHKALLLPREARFAVVNELWSLRVFTVCLNNDVKYLLR
jgi:hypothetical protein